MKDRKEEVFMWIITLWIHQSLTIDSLAIRLNMEEHSIQRVFIKWILRITHLKIIMQVWLLILSSTKTLSRVEWESKTIYSIREWIIQEYKYSLMLGSSISALVIIFLMGVLII